MLPNTFSNPIINNSEFYDLLTHDKVLKGYFLKQIAMGDQYT